MYNKVNFVDNITPLSAENLNKMDDGIAKAHERIDSIGETGVDLSNYYNKQQIGRAHV